MAVSGERIVLSLFVVVKMSHFLSVIILQQNYIKNFCLLQLANYKIHTKEILFLWHAFTTKKIATSENLQAAR